MSFNIFTMQMIFCKFGEENLSGLATVTIFSIAIITPHADIKNPRRLLKFLTSHFLHMFYNKNSPKDWSLVLYLVINTMDN